MISTLQENKLSYNEVKCDRAKWNWMYVPPCPSRPCVLIYCPECSYFSPSDTSPESILWGQAPCLLCSLNSHISLQSIFHGGNISARVEQMRKLWWMRKPAMSSLTQHRWRELWEIRADVVPYTIYHYFHLHHIKDFWLAFAFWISSLGSSNGKWCTEPRLPGFPS